MSLRHTEEKLSRVDFSRLMGRIHVSLADVDPATGIAPPFLLLKDGCRKLPIEPVIKTILSSPAANDDQIVEIMKENGLCPTDVEVVRNYIHRFGPDVTAPQPLPETDKVLLLDENLPLGTMLSLTQAFGWATHVQAEGLAGRNTKDELIWEFANDNGIEGVVTRDADFFGIHHRRYPAACEASGTAPRLIFIEGNTNKTHLTEIFTTKAAEIRQILDSSYSGCVLKIDGTCQPLP